VAPPVYIIAASARTPLGLDAEASTAAVRAGISALSEHPFLVDQTGDMMPGALDAEIDPYVFGSDRLVLLAESALRNLLDTVKTGSVPKPLLSVFLGLPELRPGFTDSDVEATRSGLGSLNDLPVELGSVNAYPQGHASGAVAFSAAVRSAQVDATSLSIVGGVESYFHPLTMEWLDSNRQLANSVSRSGFVPGEGAAFLLLAGSEAVKLFGMKPIARVDAVGVATETKLIRTSDTCLGEGLTEAVKKAVSGLRPPDQAISDILCDLNTERYRGEEWGFVCLRLAQFFEDPTTYLSPSDRWGDMGAASVPLFAMLACDAAQKGYSTGSRALLWASSENGLRGAVRLEMNNGGGNG